MPRFFATLSILSLSQASPASPFLFPFLFRQQRPFFGSSRHADEKVRGTQFYFKGISDGVAEPGIRWWRINRFISGKSTKFCFQKKRIP